MWLFETPKTYSEMCTKISKSVFFISLIELFILAQISPVFSGFMKVISFNTETEVIGIKLYVAYIYVPIILSVLENIFKLHDKMGRIIKLRKIFDGKVIFSAYIKELGITLPKSSVKPYKIYAESEELRSKISSHFYYYVSSTTPRIDEHYVHMALDSWCWVWILLDNIAISLLLCIAAMALKFSSLSISWWLMIGLFIYSALLTGLLLLLLMTSCKSNSINEVKAAVKEDCENEKGKRNSELKKEIENALLNK